MPSGQCNGQCTFVPHQPLQLKPTCACRRYSRTHYDKLGPAICEDGKDIKIALEENVANAKGGRSEAVVFLRQSDRTDVIRTIFVGDADTFGKVRLISSGFSISLGQTPF